MNTIANKMINTKSSIGDIKPKHAIKPDIVNLKKSETYLKEKVLPEDGYIDIYISLVNNMEMKKDELMTLYGVKISIDWTEL